MKHQDIINGIKAVAQQCMPQGSVLMLYGSQARGDNHEDSDWDLLILLEKEKISNNDHDRVAFPFTYYGWEINENIVPIVYTKKQWDSYSFTPFYKNVEQDKIKIYES